MKTILLEVEDNAYQTVLDFISLLPKNQCRLLEENQLSDQSRTTTYSTLFKSNSARQL